MKYKLTPQQIIKDLPDAVKDPLNYEKIQRALLDTLASKHSHSEVSGWHKCVSCQRRVLDHKELMVKLGFKTGAHYLAWRKIMEVMITGKRDPLR